ncbi:MAG: hypothetical protein KIG83_01525 [Treponema sp.]|nr:hypothetical protein [Treponema sp.]
MVAYLCLILVILCFIGYFVFSLIQLIPLAIILIIDSLIFIVVKKLFKKGGLAILGALLLIATALVPTGYFGYKSLICCVSCQEKKAGKIIRQFTNSYILG